MNTLTKGLADPIHDGQQIFRRILKAMSEPGEILSTPDCEAPGQLNSSSYALCLTLLDQHTPLWLSPELRDPSVQHSLQFHTGVPLTDSRESAAFGVAHAVEIDDLEGFHQGSTETPETSCTLILQVNRIAAQADGEDSSLGLNLRGPGIDGQRKIWIAGLGDAIAKHLVQHSSVFPRGLDFIFTAGTSLTCFPRTTHVEVL